MQGIVSDVSRRFMSYSATPAVRTLRSGSRGDDVRDLQALLTELGVYRGAIDGIYGGQTTEAVRTFQRRHGLTADGVVGPATRASLAAVARNGEPASGSTSRAESHGLAERPEDVAPRSDPGVAALSAPRAGGSAPIPAAPVVSAPTLAPFGASPAPLPGASGVAGCDMRDAQIAGLYY
jgi:hypothetical protein